MSTVFNAINLPINGTLDSLGPVQIVSIGQTKQSKNNKSFRSVKVSDGSGEISIMMWEPSCFLALAPGQTVFFSGQMKREEYPVGTPKLRSEGGITMATTGAAVPSPQQGATGGNATQQGGAPSAGNQRSNSPMTALIDYGLACVRYSSKQMTDRGENFGDALAASIFGSAMYGYKEGRSIAPPSPEAEAKRKAAEAEAARLAEEARLAAEAILAGGRPPADENTSDDPDEIPF